MVDFKEKLQSMKEEKQELVAQGNMQQALAELAEPEEPTFNLPALYQPEEAMEVIQENLEGFDVRFDKIKMPSGGGISFTVLDEDGEENPVKELMGIILDKKPIGMWFIKGYDEKDPDDIGIPDCFSADGVTGSGCEEAGIPAGQLCAKCPKGQWGSARRGGKGKDCADKIRIHVLMEGSVFPIIIDLPPTSLENFRDYIKRLANKVKPFYGVVTKIKLDKDKTDGNIEYSRATFSRAADLTPAEKKAIKGYIETLKPSMQVITKESLADVVDIEDDDDVIADTATSSEPAGSAY